MSIEVFNFEQGSQEWIEARLGIPTASEFSCVQAKGRDGGASKTRRAYMLRLADEIIYRDQPVETFTNPNLERGKEYEPEARDIYALMHDVELERVGFIRNGQMGCSPDSLIGESGILEVKTTFPRLLAELQLDDEFPPAHKAQCQGELLITGRDWIDLIVYWPKRHPFLKRAYRDDAYIKNLADQVERFNDELAQMVERLKAYIRDVGAAAGANAAADRRRRG